MIGYGTFSPDSIAIFGKIFLDLLITLLSNMVQSKFDSYPRAEFVQPASICFGGP